MSGRKLGASTSAFSLSGIDEFPVYGDGGAGQLRGPFICNDF